MVYTNFSAHKIQMKLESVYNFARGPSFKGGKTKESTQVNKTASI